jgi:twinkle protein
MITQDSVQAVKDRAKVAEVVGDFVKLKKDGADLSGLCPFHAEKTPSFKVSPAKDMYKCFGCGKSGDSIAFLMDHQNLSYIAAIEKLAHKYNVTLEYDGPKKEYVKPVKRLEKLGVKALSWMEKERGISNNTLLRFGITESMEWMPKAGKEVLAMCFNYLRDGELINIKFRGPQKDFKMAKDAELIFYNLDAIKDAKECIIVEGEIDCLSMYEAGIYNVVSVPNGAGAGNLKLDYLDNCWHYFEGKERIVLMVDNDEAGYNLREELGRRLGKDRCYKVEYPKGCKDANEVLLKHGKDAINAMIDKAVLWPIEGVITMDEMFEDVCNFYENGYPQGTKSLISGLDDYISFMPGQLTTVTGIPGSGKSEFVDYIMCQLTMNNSWSWAIASFENQPSSLHVTKLMEKITGKAFQFRRVPEQRISVNEFKESVAIVDKYFNFININTVDVTLTGLLQKARELVVRKGVNGLLIDPWNYIEHKVPKGYTETQYISECLTEIKSFAVKNGVHVFLIAHPTKMAKDKKTGKYEIPTLYSISGSAHFFNKTDNGMTIYRDFKDNVVEVHIQKIRFSWTGKIGFCAFNYDTFTRKYEPILDI